MQIAVINYLPKTTDPTLTIKFSILAEYTTKLH